MNSKRLLQQVFGLMLVMLLLAGCGGAPAESTSTPTPIPPTATPTPTATDTPTPIPTPTAIPPSEMPFTIGSFQLQITSVSFRTVHKVTPAGIGEKVPTIAVEIKVLTGDPGIVAKSDGEFDVWTTDDSGTRNSFRVTTTTASGDGEIRAIQWLFSVDESSESFYLHFPSGVTVDLSPLLP